MTSIRLNRDQISKLTAIADQFYNATEFTIETDSSSGIGPATIVKFKLFDHNDTQIDITDTREW